MSEFAKVILEVVSFSLLSVVVFGLAKKIKVPYTVLLVIVGTFLYFLIPAFDFHFYLFVFLFFFTLILLRYELLY